MSKSLLLVHPDGAVRRDIRTLMATADVELSEASQLSLFDLGNPDLALIAWRALKQPAESLRWLKQNGAAKDLRVIVLSDRPDYAAAIRSLEYGADDCVGVPLQGDELLLRVNACLGRPQVSPAEPRLTAGPIVLDRGKHKVSVCDEALNLAPTEFRLLAFLLENQGRVFSRDELLSRAWSSHVRAGHRTVDVHVRRLRQQLERYGCQELIQTVRGFGYRLRAD
jgi:two-component system, OmpR family, phosphate regulon response regulator PhoB